MSKKFNVLEPVAAEITWQPGDLFFVERAVIWRIGGFPYYENFWVDGELIYVDAKWFQDGSGQGQYGQDCPLPFLIRLFNKQERDYNRYIGGKAFLEFSAEDMSPMPTTQLQLESVLTKNHFKVSIRSWPQWVDGLTWWQRLEPVTVQQRAQTDPLLEWEILHGDWDQRSRHRFGGGAFL